MLVATASPSQKGGAEKVKKNEGVSKGALRPNSSN
jgi:hypothetical protein